MRRTVLFDLDGTLVDSVPDLLASGNRVGARMGLAQFTKDELVPMIGDGAGVLVRRLLASRGRDATAADLRAFVDDYTAHVADETRPYAGIPAVLDALSAAGWTLAVATNKPEAPARIVLDRLGLLGRFAAVAGGDTHPVRKPDPGHLLLTLAALGLDPLGAVMVGDHHNDLAAAAAADIPSVFVSWGYGQDTGATRAVDRPADLPGVIAELATAPRTSSRRRTSAS